MNTFFVLNKEECGNSTTLRLAMARGSLGYLLFSIVLILTVSGENGILDTRLNNGAELERQVVIQFSSGEMAHRSLMTLGLIVSFLKCSCSLDSCKCCINLKFVSEKSCCIYLQYDRGDVRGGVSIGDASVLNFHVTGTSSSEPASCFNVTLPMAVGVCFQFYKTKWDRQQKTLHACSKLELVVMKTSVYKGRIGCLELGAGGVRQIPRSKERKLEKEVVRVDMNTSLYNSRFGCLEMGAGGVRQLQRSKGGNPDKEVVRVGTTSEWRKLQTCFLAMERGQTNKHCA